MPIECQHDRNPAVITAHGTGRVTDHDLLVTARILSDVAAVADLTMLVDLRSVTQCTVSSDAILALVNLHRHSAQQRGRARVAIVTSTDLAFGLSRMYAAQVEGSAIDVGVFRDIHQGQAWLNQPLQHNRPDEP